MSKAEELIACLEGEIAKRDEELAACRVAVENCEVFRARIVELEDDLKCAHSMLAEVSKAGMALRAELSAIKAQEPVAEVKHGPLDSSGWPEFVRVKTIGDFDLENLPSGMKLYAAPAAPAADAWISVSERLPNIAQEVIVHSEFEGVCAGILDSYGEWFAPCSDYRLTRITSWMPMPTKIEANRHD